MNARYPRGRLLLNVAPSVAYPVVVDENVPRDVTGVALLSPRVGVHMHPLMVIELAAGDDLGGRSKAALLWIQERIAEQAAAAVQRIELMHRPELSRVREFARQINRVIARRMAQEERRARLLAEGDYRFPVVLEDNQL